MKHCRKHAFLLALSVCASLALTACSSDDGADVLSDTDGIDTAANIRQELPLGDETKAETAPPVVLPAETEAPEVVVTPSTPEEDPSQEIPSVEMNEDDTADDADPITEPEEPAGVLAPYIGQTASGRFVSEQSEKLVLCIDWESVIGEDGVAGVGITVGLSHYRFYSRAKSQMGAVQVDGNAILFDTPAIECDENTQTYTFFGSYFIETERSEMEVEAAWQVLGQYGGVEIDTLTAGGTIVLAEDS